MSDTALVMSTRSDRRQLYPRTTIDDVVGAAAGAEAFGTGEEVVLADSLEARTENEPRASWADSLRAVVSVEAMSVKLPVLTERQAPLNKHHRKQFLREALIRDRAEESFDCHRAD